MSGQEVVSVPRPVVFTVRLSRDLHSKFKKLCTDLDNLDMTVVVRTMIKLFLEDPEFRSRVLGELQGGGDGV